ncbi:MAG: reverse gyrase [Nitrososphaerota archaeon]
MEIRSIYDFACSNCGGEIADARLIEVGVCEKCLPGKAAGLIEAAEALKKAGRLQKLKEYLRIQLEYEEFRRFFRRALGFEPWALQEVWAKRIISGDNFAIVAPTGVGKTVLGLIMALYLYAARRRRCYVIVPSSILVQQLYEKAISFAERLGLRISDGLLLYHAGLSRAERENVLNSLRKNDGPIILITTDRFLIDHGDLLMGIKPFDYVFVDDVDSFLKSPKNIDKAIGLLGLRPEAVDLALKLIDVRIKLARSPSKGLSDEYERLSRAVEEERKRRRGILVVAGATLRGRRTRRMMIFEELLDFEVGRFQELVRNVEDLYVEPAGSPIEETVKLVKRHGGGCLVFIPHALGRSYAENVAEALEKAGIKVHLYRKMSQDILQKFASGEIDAMVGIASSRSPFTRGIDLPSRIRYAVFAGVPRREIRIEKAEYNPAKLLILILNLMPILDERSRRESEPIIAKLRKITPLTKDVMEKIRRADEEGMKLDGFEGYAQEVIASAREFVGKILSPQLLERIERDLDITLKQAGDGFTLIIPDTTGYIQASGRTSRLYPYGIMKGASIVVVDDARAFRGLIARLKAQIEELDFEPYDEKKAELIFEQIDRERKLLGEIQRGEVEIRVKDLVRAALMLVESPTKARTIAHLFGRPFRRRIGPLTVYEAAIGGMIVGVAATQGHITDLITGSERGLHGVENMNGRFIPVYGVIKRCYNCGEQWADGRPCPSCGSDDIFDKIEIIEAIRRLAQQYNEVYLATDPDAEGEKIAYDLMCLIKPFNPNIHRLEFHEVTRRALLSALQSKRSVSISLVEAQLLRRIEDRWIGFELSRKLWERFGSRWLSAGRVQTPVLGWIAERTSDYKKKRMMIRVRLGENLYIDILEPENVEEVLREWETGRLKATVRILGEEEVTVNPPPPYTTDSLLRDASSYLKLSAANAMRVAQDLFEAGLITYHRTDATTVSQVGMSIAREYLSRIDPSLFAPRAYRMEGAHECIRPVKPLDAEKLRYYVRIGLITIPAARLTETHYRMYDLIFRRFIASQCRPAKIVTQRISVDVLGNSVELSRDVKLLDKGFLEFYPVIRIADRVEAGEYPVSGLEVRKVPSAWLLTEGDVVALMKERGIGRPSTYSKIIETLLERGYAIERNGRLIATKKGITVYRYLIERFGDYVSEELTRRLEADMDRVESGKADYQKILEELYQEVMAIRAAPAVSR